MGLEHWFIGKEPWLPFQGMDLGLTPSTQWQLKLSVTTGPRDPMPSSDLQTPGMNVVHIHACKTFTDKKK